MPFISKNTANPSLVIAAAALCAGAVQCVFLREYLAVFSGNELVVGIVLSVWLCATGLGSLAGARAVNRLASAAAPAALIALAAGGLLCIRASRLVFLPGQLIGPLLILLLCAVGEAPFAFVNGYLFGSLSGSLRSRNPYGWESLGALWGCLLVYACVLLYCNNTLILCVSMVPLFMTFRKNACFALAAVACAALLLAYNGASIRWKYPFPFSDVVYGREGEIARMQGGGDTTYMLNGSVYKSTAQLPLIEQAVHVPMAQRAGHVHALVLFDKGHRGELEKYPGLSVDCIESEPRIASEGSMLTPPENFRPRWRYDIIVLGAGMPQNAAGGRFFTVSFFRKMQSLLTDSGVFSFTLQMSENYMPPAEKRLYDVLRNTLGAVFASVEVFPGNGFTFMASGKPFPPSWKPVVDTRYLGASILPSVSSERIAEANKKPGRTALNTTQRPIGLALALLLWIEQFREGALIIAAAFLLFLLVAVAIMPRSKEVLAMTTTGFAAGGYSIALLMLYQSTYGLLYSRISLLLISLTCGFAVGSFIKRFPRPDLVIGIYCLTSLGLLIALPYPPAILFYAAHWAMGVFTGAQFIALKKTPASALYAADLFGGALGMALCSTLLVPLFGIWAVAGGICLMKIIAWFFARKVA